MATKNKKSTKKLSFRKTSPLKMLLAVVVVSAVAGIGTYLLTRSNAAVGTAIPENLRYSIQIGSIRASDGVTLPVTCTSVTGMTSYGPIANCVQFKDNGAACGETKNQIRPGFYSTITKVFSPSGGYSTVTNPCKGWAQGIGYPELPVTCVNNIMAETGFGRFEFISNYRLFSNTAYGPVMNGQIYRYYGGRWQVRWATYSGITKECAPTGIWMDAKYEKF